MTQSAVQNRY